MQTVDNQYARISVPFQNPTKNKSSGLNSACVIARYLSMENIWSLLESSEPTNVKWLLSGPNPTGLGMP